MPPDAAPPPPPPPDAALPPDAGAPDLRDAPVEAAPPPDTSSDKPDFTWLYRSTGASICFNSWYFSGTDRAVLLFWSGPRADAWHGPTSTKVGTEFCWNLSSWPKGLYSFWSDVPDPSCGADWCLRDDDPYTGALYGEAPLVTGPPRKWVTCDYSGCKTGGTCGCNGIAYFDGTTWVPEGG
jgi:hypothetical protein